MSQIQFVRQFVLFSICLLLLIVDTSHGAVFLGPSPYLSLADSPFVGTGLGYFYLENFEDGLSNSPGLITSQGVEKNPGLETDSVDADDGVIDGLGRNGHSWFPAKPSVQFRFDANTLHSLPTRVGVVITDIGFSTSGGTSGVGNFTFEAFGPNDVSLGTIGPFSFGDGAVNGGTAEDRFVGVIDPGGIEHFNITTSTIDWEVDHVQYGSLVPEPTAMVLFALGVSIACCLRRR